MEAPNAVVIIPLKLQLTDHNGITGFAKGRMVGYAAVRNIQRCAGIAVSTPGPFHGDGVLESSCLRTIGARCSSSLREGPGVGLVERTLLLIPAL